MKYSTVLDIIMDEKRCKRCEKLYPLSEFYNNSRNKSGKDHWCKHCRRDYDRQWEAKNRDRLLARRRELYAAKKKGVEPEPIEYDAGVVVTGDNHKDLAIAILKRAVWDVEGRYIRINGKRKKDAIQAAKEDALAWFEKSQQCQDFLNWLGVRIDVMPMVERIANGSRV